MRPLKNTCEIAVIGGGLAGLSAARHAARLGRLVTLFDGSGLWGGLVATIGEVEGLPFPGKHSGQDIAIPLLEQARLAAVRIVEADVPRIEVDEHLLLTDAEGREYHPAAVIVASGAALRRLGVPGEEEFVGRGVSRCATCDGSFYRGEDVVVTGSGDGAVHEALVLAKTSRQVIMVCRSPLKAKREYIDKLAARENVRFVWDSEVVAVLGETGVAAVEVRNVKDGMRSRIDCAGFFPFIGVAPNSACVPPALRTATGQVPTNEEYATVEPRIFAAGAVRAGYGGNAIEALAEGVGAAAAAVRLLTGCNGKDRS